MNETVKRLFTWRTAIIESDLSPTTRHVLLTLSLWMSEAGENAFPSTKTLEKATGLSERSVCTHLQKAEVLGWLEKEVHGYGRRNWARHEYHPKTPSQGTEPNDNKALNLVQEKAKNGNKALNLTTQGTEPNDNKALKEVQSNTPVNTPKNTPANKQKKKSSIPENFGVSGGVKDWANNKGHENLEAHLESFVLACEKHDYKYVDWDAAFKTAVRDDWAKVGIVAAGLGGVSLDDAGPVL